MQDARRRDERAPGAQSEPIRVPRARGRFDLVHSTGTLVPTNSDECLVTDQNRDSAVRQAARGVRLYLGTHGMTAQLTVPRDGVPVRGSMVLPFLWEALIFVPGGALALTYSFYVLNWSPLDFSALASGAIVFAAYLGWSAQGAMAYSVTVSTEGVEVHHRPVLVPFRRPRRTTRVKWQELREPSVKMGGVTIRTDNPWSWLNLNYEQARVVLSDPRCPFYGKVPKQIAARLGIASP